MADFIETFLDETAQIAKTIDRKAIAGAISELKALKARGGRLFLIGVGGSAGNCSHAVNDFRKICGIESYTPSDNVSELTARINDESWEMCYANWLKGSKLSKNDAVMCFSVGGGSATTSLNLVRSMELAREVGAPILSVVSRDGGKAKELSTVCILVPVVAKERITPHAESWQAVVWHLLVNAI
ncbi:MAG TPA: SIS domain-containing protein [Planctomycetota bacterium]|nr:SIS domain-containing protein [Planctomycetota bacterium]